MKQKHKNLCFSQKEAAGGVRKIQMVFWTKVQDVKVVQAQQMIQYLDTLPKETENDFANIKQKIT